MRKQLLTLTATAGLVFTAFQNPASAHELTYQVRSGDMLWKIAQANNLSISQLMEWNSLTDYVIYPGQSLNLMEPHNHEEVNREADYYIVKSGDTLWGIANSNKLTIDALKSLNNLNSNFVYPGQKLLVKPAQPAPPFDRPDSINTYTVQNGDSLWKIATENNLSVTQLMSMNSLNSNVIYVGQKLTVQQATATQIKESEVSKVDALIAEAKKYIGVPYVWGGSSPAGFDCSGYLNYVFNHAGISIPRTVLTIWNATKSVSSPDIGDIVFFNTSSAGPSHAGIYLGNNKFIHSGSSTGVTISDMTLTYWKTRYLGAKTAF
ncbi:LysM peptidoglycan-binding domain-containing protein [Bacillus sp. JJ1773]|uniref:C40 family peptidase n=1 Tax=Bacillus sp. JJ1773 TaxID=3122965 RepID=UPI002FFF6D32